MSACAREITPIELGMHHHLFGVNANHVAHLNDAAMWRTLRELRSAPELERFGLFLVGSRLDPGNETSDIDLVLSPRPGSAFTDRLIERALWHCRDYGLYGADLARLIDVSFRKEGPSFRAIPLPPDRVLQTAKLFSPKLASLVNEGRIQHYRRFGLFSIEYWRRASETSFYQKLPQQQFDGSLCSYLRPAIEVIPDPL
jgi:hypothetical protein